MGRVKRQPEPVDKGTPGMFYFEEPVVIKVPGKAKVMTFPTSTSGADALSKIGVCRLRSSYKMQQYDPPQDVVYDLTEHPTQQEVREYFHKMTIGGFGEGAIVARRYAPKGRWKYFHQWGILVIEHTVPPSAGKWAPYSVRWLNDNSVEQAWAEDLVVIHSTLGEEMLTDIVESQGVDVV
jgi:hypothetical protein